MLALPFSLKKFFSLHGYFFWEVYKYIIFFSLPLISSTKQAELFSSLSLSLQLLQAEYMFLKQEGL